MVTGFGCMVVFWCNPIVLTTSVSSAGVCVGCLSKVPCYSPNLEERFSEAVSRKLVELCSVS